MKIGKDNRDSHTPSLVRAPSSEFLLERIVTLIAGMRVERVSQLHRPPLFIDYAHIP